jgi:NAD(P) transhydrogenase
MPTHHYDLIVIGTGPAGEGAALKAAKSGKRVAAIEHYTEVGGGATHWGTIPSKALRAAIQHVNLVHRNPVYRRIDITPTFSFPELLGRAQVIVDMQARLRASFYNHNGVSLIAGHARFLDPHRVRVEGRHGAAQECTADYFMIATGSRPYRPADIDFTHPRILDSDRLLHIPTTPKSAIIYGAGVIGCEYASMLSNMDMDITLVNTRERLLSFLDAEISDALSFHFSDQGVRILHGETYQCVESHGGFDDPAGFVELRLQSGKIIKADVLLFANGRSGNCEELGLDTIGVVPNARGNIPVNENLQVRIASADVVAPDNALSGQAAIVGRPHPAQTLRPASNHCHPHIFAAGDIIGRPGLASASYDQGRFGATYIVSGQPEYQLVFDVPTGIYTSPEISSLGRTEAQLTAERVPYVSGKALFRTLARAQITGQTAGMLKLLIHRETLEILGVHCFGESATEIIHIGQAIMSSSGAANNLNYFIHTTFNYPTMAEAYRVAALNGLDML